MAPVGVRAARARDRLVAATTDRARVDAIATLLELGGGLDAVVLVARDGELASRVYTARGGLGPARAIGDDLAAVLRPLRPLPRVVPRDGGGGGGGGGVKVPLPLVTPWYERRWAQVSFGVGATAIVVGVVAAIVARDPGSSALMPTIEVE